MKHRGLLVLTVVFAISYIVTTLLSAPDKLMGLSTVLGTTVLGTTVLGVSLIPALASTQLYLSLTCIGILVFLELSDPSYGPTAKLATTLRENWLPFAAFLVGLFFLIVAFKVLSILGF